MTTAYKTRHHSKESFQRKDVIHSFYTLSDESRRITIEISTNPPENTTSKTVKASPTTGIMRGHKQFIGYGPTAQQAVRDCLSRIVGRPVQADLDALSQEIIFGSDLVTDPVADISPATSTQVTYQQPHS